MTSPFDPHGLVTTVGGADHLVGSACTACETHTFPTQDACPRCGSSTEPVALPRDGTLWSWTVQRVRPKPPYDGPEEFEPYAVGYVDLGPLKVAARLDGRHVSDWTIGASMRLATSMADDRGDVWRYRFVEVPA